MIRNLLLISSVNLFIISVYTLQDCHPSINLGAAHKKNRAKKCFSLNCIKKLEITIKWNNNDLNRKMEHRCATSCLRGSAAPWKDCLLLKGAWTVPCPLPSHALLQHFFGYSLASNSCSPEGIGSRVEWPGQSSRLGGGKAVCREFILGCQELGQQR